MWKWFTNRKLGQKLALAFAMILVLSGVIAVEGFRGVYTTNTLLDDFSSTLLPSVDFVIEADRDLQQLLVAERSMIFCDTSSDQFKRLLDDYQTNLQQAQERWQSYKKLPHGAKEDEIIPQYESAWSDWLEDSRKVVEGRKADTIAGRALAIDLTLGRAESRFNAMREYLNQIQEALLERAKAKEAESEETVQGVIWWIVVSAVFAVGIGILLAGVINRSVARPVRRMAETAKRISLGDFEQRIEHRSLDETGLLADAFREMIGYVRSVSAAAEALSQGDISSRLSERSENDVLSRSVNGVAETLARLVQETGILLRAAQDGKLKTRGDARVFQGGYQELVEGINRLLDAIIEPLNEASEVLQRVAARDLAARMTGTYHGDFDQLRVALNEAVSNLDEALMDTAARAEQLAVASGQISSSSQALASASSEQAGSLEEVSGSLQEMTSMTAKNSENAHQATALTLDSRTSAERGFESMKRLSESMDAIKRSADATAKIVKTIDEIAFQTNLLALNAAVEAARAGESGKGFAVVAEEVRNLAMRSAEAAKNTASLIEESVKNADSGVAVNQEVLQNLEDIHQHVRRASEVMTEIAEASEQQRSGIDQINIAVEQMGRVTQQTAASSEESAGVAQELSSQAGEMNDLVAGFHLSRRKSSSELQSRTPAEKPRPLNGLSRKKDRAGRLELPDLSFVNGKAATAQDLLEF